MEHKRESAKSWFLAGLGAAGAAVNLAWFSDGLRQILPEPLKYHSGDFSFGAVIAIGSLAASEHVRRRFGETAGQVVLAVGLATGIVLMAANEGFGLGFGTPAWPDLHAAAAGLALGALVIHDLHRRFHSLPDSPTSRALRLAGILPDSSMHRHL